MDPAVFQPRPARLRPRQDRRVMLYVGAVSPHKGVHDVVDTFIELAAARPDLQLHVIGPPGVYPLEEIYAPGDPRATALAPYYQGDYAAMLRRRIPPALAGRVLWLGGQTSEQVAARMADADVVCCASVCDEGFLLPAVEAAGTGTPVVATRVGAVPEVVLDGVTGLLVPPCDPAALADATARVLDDRSLANRLGAAAAARAHKQFTWPRQAETLWRYYTSAPAGQAAARGYRGRCDPT
jgi:glycosyltransferase involved in cell wall biosynthesis